MPVKYKGSRSVHKPIKSKLNEQEGIIEPTKTPTPINPYSKVETIALALYLILLMIFFSYMFYYIAAN